jgi:hypothetical protein
LSIDTQRFLEREESKMEAEMPTENHGEKGDLPWRSFNKNPPAVMS